MILIIKIRSKSKTNQKQIKGFRMIGLLEQGFTLVELLIYLSLTTLLFSTIVFFSFSINKMISANDLILVREQTADLIFSSFIKLKNQNLFKCDNEGAFQFYLNSWHKIGSIESKGCQINKILEEDQDKMIELSFLVLNKKFELKVY